MSAPPLLQVQGLRKRFPTARNVLGRPTRWLDAVSDVTFDLAAGTTLALVGETGAGKSTVGRLVLRLIEPDGGSVHVNGRDILELSPKELREQRREMQMIFQDPYGSLDPRMSVGAAVAEALTVHFGARGSEREDRVVELFGRVGLRADQYDRYPHELSGGQLQRVAIARSLVTDPSLIVCDEPVAALDVSVQAQVLNLLLDLQHERGLGYVFITHDLSLVRLLADDVIVMRHGEVVERGACDDLFAAPRHPYTRQLLDATPVARPRRVPAAAR